MGHPTRQHGFTLLELMIGIILLAIFAAMAVPAFQAFIARNRVRSASEQLRSALIFTRSEAVKRSQTITLTCNAGGCQQGWIIATTASPTLQLAVQNTFNDNNLTVTGATTASVNRNGRAAAATSFTVARTDQGSQRCVKLYLSGLTDVADSGC
ncbi:GspH/FimT family pseudopilin [Vogesella sp. LIG4]|uniref:GspH/FimT family pseudopilin n=1 Tax=Vogesella sp. LIG4 TaxID=1192162 RepID=UPI000B5ADB2B|nr:GspH/FimT family pseudopilin [Vogesella sp. LIG4]